MVLTENNKIQHSRFHVLSPKQKQIKTGIVFFSKVQTRFEFWDLLSSILHYIKKETNEQCNFWEKAKAKLNRNSTSRYFGKRYSSEMSKNCLKLQYGRNFNILDYEIRFFLFFSYPQPVFKPAATFRKGLYNFARVRMYACARTYVYVKILIGS